MSHTKALEQAIYYFEHRETLDREAKANAAIELAEWDVFSNRQISLILGMSKGDVAQYTGKSDHRGGLLKPEALRPILNLIQLEMRGEVDHRAVLAAKKAGASIDTIAKLTGRPQRTLYRHSKRAEAA